MLDYLEERIDNYEADIEELAIEIEELERIRQRMKIETLTNEIYYKNKKRDECVLKLREVRTIYRMYKQLEKI